MKFRRKRFAILPAMVLVALLSAELLPAQTQTAHTQTAPTQTTQTQPPQPPAAQAAKRAGAPVLVDEKPIFFVLERTLSFSPNDRAKAIGEKIRKLAKGPLADIQAIKVADAETTTEIVSGEMVIMTVTDQDAAAAGRPRQQLAAEYAQKIRSAAESLRRQFSLKTILLGVLWSVLATAALIVILKLIGLLFSRLYALVRSWHGRYIRSIRIQKLELLRADRITDFLLLASRVTRFVLVLLVLYLYISLVFSFFPWTRGYAAVFLGLVLYPLRTVGAAAVSFLPNAFFIVVILIVSYYTIKVVKFVFLEIGKGTIRWPGFYPEWAEPTYAIARFLIIAFTAVVVFPYLPGSKSPAFQGVSLFLGLLFSLGSSSAIANIVAGIVLTYTRAFQIGDRVKVGDAVGDVIERTLLVTRVRTIKNVDISIPNAMVLSTHIVNFSSSAQVAGLILHTSVTIGYDAPWHVVHELLIQAADSTEQIEKEPRPFVLQTSLDDFYVTYELNAYTKQPGKMAATYSELHQNIQNKFNEANVEIMSPHYGSVRDGNQTTVPQDYLPKDYAAPAFRVQPLEWIGPPKSTGRD